MGIVKHLITAFLVGIAIFILFGILEYVYGHGFSNVRELLLFFSFSQLYTVTLYMVNAYYFDLLLKWFPNQVFKAKNLAKGIFGGVLLTALVLFLIRAFLETVVKGRTLNDFFDHVQFSHFYISFLISIVVTAIFYTVYYYQNKQEKQVKEQKIIAGTASAKFDALKNQLDPHFLFNSLNVLTSLITENPEAAARFTTSLSKVYRYVLEQKNKELVSLEEEMKFAELYMSLLSVRFEDSIVYTIPQQLQNPQAQVVPLSLQLLLENAVKHNQVTQNKKLHIEISEIDGRLTITNNYQPKQVLKQSTGVGLKNIQDRYRFLTDRSVLIQQNRKEFSVSIPILGENLKIMNPQETYISEKRYKLAKKHVDELKVFYIHFGIYLLFIPVFIYLNLISGTGFPWALFPIFGWGFGVASHAAETFNYNPFFGKKWEERKIRELMKKD